MQTRFQEAAHVDLDAYAGAHADEWRRLDELVRRAARPGRLSGAEVDELVELYQRTSTHLSVVRSASPDPAVVARLSALVARSRAAVTGTPGSAWQNATHFFAASFPAAVWWARWWATGAAAGFLAVAGAVGAWVAAAPRVQAAIAAPDEIRQLVDRDFAHYYSEHPASAFAAQVWTNNAWVAAGTLTLGVLLGLPTLYILWANAANLGVAGGLMAAHGKAGVFFGLITPHGLLELTAVFVAAGVGLRLGWTVIDSGPRLRSRALAEQGRAAVGVALGLVPVLAVSGGIEAFVTPSALPTWARIGVGVAAEAAFLGYVISFGRRAAAAGERGDLGAQLRGDEAPSAG